MWIEILTFWLVWGNRLYASGGRIIELWQLLYYIYNEYDWLQTQNTGTQEKTQADSQSEQQVI